MRQITMQSTNKLTIVGKLLDTTFGAGKDKNGKPYERANLTVRVTQNYGGREETSDIPVSMFVSQYTNAGTADPAFASFQELKTLKTVQKCGLNEADTICFTRAQLSENAFVAKSGQLITGFQISSKYFSNKKTTEAATFAVDVFIMDMHDEVDREGETTGRLVIKGGIVQYNGKLDVVEFIVESPDAVEHISRYWQVNQTVQLRGRVRFTSVEESRPVSEDSWGEDIPETSTRMVRELIVTKGDEYEEEASYDSTDIRKAFNARKARLEQLTLEAKTKAQSKPAPAANAKASWE